MTIKTLLATATLATIATASTAMAAVAPFSATYNFSIENKYKGTAVRSLKQVGNQYQYDMSASVGKLASAKQNAVFINQNGVVTPLSSLTQYKVFGSGRTSTFNFYPSKRQFISKYKGKVQTVAMPQTAYDDLSLEIQMREDLKAGKFRSTYAMADQNKIEMVPFTKSAVTKVTVPAGTFDVVRIDRVHSDKTRKTSFWLAPKLDYLPVKVVQNDSGKTMQMNLSKVN